MYGKKLCVNKLTIVGNRGGCRLVVWRKENGGEGGESEGEKVVRFYFFLDGISLIDPLLGRGERTRDVSLMTGRNADGCAWVTMWCEQIAGAARYHHHTPALFIIRFHRFFFCFFFLHVGEKNKEKNGEKV